MAINWRQSRPCVALVVIQYIEYFWQQSTQRTFIVTTGRTTPNLREYFTKSAITTQRTKRGFLFGTTVACIQSSRKCSRVYSLAHGFGIILINARWVIFLCMCLERVCKTGYYLFRIRSLITLYKILDHKQDRSVNQFVDYESTVFIQSHISFSYFRYFFRRFGETSKANFGRSFGPKSHVSFQKYMGPCYFGNVAYIYIYIIYF